MTATSHDMLVRRVHALAVGLSLLVVAFVLTVIVAGDPVGSVLQPADDAWLDAMVDVRTPALTTLAKALAVVGGPFVMVPLRLVVLAALAVRRRWLQLGAFLGATVTSELCIGPLKALIDRPRPPDPLIVSHSSAFPSGHAIAASVTAIGLVVVLVPARRRRTRATVVAVAFAALMATSRTYLGAHWASDVIAGLCIGTGLALVWPAALELVRDRRRALAAPGPPVATGRFGRVRVAAVGLLGLGIGCVVALHVLRADLAPAGHRISEYAGGRFGPVMTVAFVCLALGLFATAAVWAWSDARSGRVAAMAVAVAGVGMLASGIWPTVPSDTLADRIHGRASALATLALVAAAVIWAVRRRPRRFDATAALATLAVALAALSPSLHRSSWTGVSQRVLWVTLLAWLIATAVALRPAPSPTSASSQPGRSP